MYVPLPSTTKCSTYSLFTQGATSVAGVCFCQPNCVKSTL